MRTYSHVMRENQKSSGPADTLHISIIYYALINPPIRNPHRDVPIPRKQISIETLFSFRDIYFDRNNLISFSF